MFAQAVVVSRLRSRHIGCVLSVLGGWLFSSSLWIYPHSLSYFNETNGGPLNGPKYLLGSNIDWGQDLRYLASWIEQHPEVQKLCLVYYGPFNPADTGFDCVEFAPIETTDVVAAETGAKRVSRHDFGGCPTVWYSISVNILNGLPWQACDVGGAKASVDEDILRLLVRSRLSISIGYSIRAYQLTCAGAVVSGVVDHHLALRGSRR